MLSALEKDDQGTFQMVGSAQDSLQDGFVTMNWCPMLPCRSWPPRPNIGKNPFLSTVRHVSVGALRTDLEVQN